MVNLLDVSLAEPQGSDYIVRYLCGVTFTIGRVREGRDGPRAEITIEGDTNVLAGRTNTLIYNGLLGLQSHSGRRDWARVCTKRTPGGDIKWEDLIDDACYRAVRNQRPRIFPQVVGGAPPKRDSPMYLIWPVLRAGVPTIIFGESGTGKSWLAAYLCALTDHGVTANGLSAGPGRSLYVDFEDTPEECGERAWAIAQGDERFNPDWQLHYKREEKLLVDAGEDLREDVERGQFDLVVIDSFGLASGGNQNDDNTVLSVLNAVRKLNATVLILDHVGKDHERGAFGSSYKRHGVRSMWELVSGGEDLQFGLFHRKTNRGRLSPPLGLKVDIFEDDNYAYQSARFSRVDVSDLPELDSSMTVPQRIIAAVKDMPNGKITRAELVDALPDVQSKHLDSKVSAMKKDGRLQDLGTGLYGLAFKE